MMQKPKPLWAVEGGERSGAVRISQQDSMIDAMNGSQTERAVRWLWNE